MSSIIRLSIIQAIQFYDAPPKRNRGQTTAITAVIGEDLGAGLLINYYRRQGCQAETLPDNVTPGTNKGSRLDRWVIVTKGKQVTHYQVEIKNWGAAAIGGRRIAIDADARTLKQHKIERWSKEWNGQGFIKAGVQKVLIPMKPPEGARHIEPLVCFWDAMHPSGGNSPLFSVKLENQHFKRVWIFSMSSYLRTLMKSGKTYLQIDAPDIVARLDWLSLLIQK